jgi:predicted aspartyl protease
MHRTDGHYAERCLTDPAPFGAYAGRHHGPRGRNQQTEDIMKVLFQLAKPIGKFLAFIMAIGVAYHIGLRDAPPMPTASTIPPDVTFDRMHHGNGVVLTVHDGGYDVKGVIGDPNAQDRMASINFAIDTGSSAMQLPEDALEWLLERGAIKRDDFKGNLISMMANGQERSVQSYNLRSVTLGDTSPGGYHVTAYNVLCIISPRGSPALLGTSFLGQFKQWHVDNENKRLYFTL